MWNRFDTCISVVACSRIVPTTRGWEWPSAVTAMPPVKSRYSLPSESHTRIPSPRTSAMGARLVNAMRCLPPVSSRAFVSTVSPVIWIRLEDDLGADALVGEDFEEHRVGDPAVDDVGLGGAPLEGLERGLDLGQHAAVDHAGLDQPLGLALGEARDELAVVAVDPLDVGEVDELLRAQSRRHVARHEIGVDVVGLAAGAHADRGDDRDEPRFHEEA